MEAAAALLGTFREAAYHEELGTVAERLEIRILRHGRISPPSAATTATASPPPS